MPKIICTRPNASLLISGVKFTPLEDGTGVISEDVSDEAAELFLSIPGYHAAEYGDGAPAAPAAAPKPAKQPKAQTAAAKPAKSAAPEAPAPEAGADTKPAAPADAGTGTGDFHSRLTVTG